MSWFKDILYETIKTGGELVSKETAAKRLQVCKQCPYFAMVNPLVGIYDEGCTLCGCPFKTKGYMKTYFSFDKMKVIDTVCPHEDGNKWKDL